jgi:hypothetical protein
MVLRRNRYIVAVDAGADEKLQFDDLGNAIRKIRIDLGIPVNIQVSSFREKDGTKVRCAYGKIEYWRIDNDSVEDPNMVGHLLYFKPVIGGDEPADVANYATAHPEFPHETTADQFFSESQLESYRMLGSYTLDSVCPASAASIPELFEAVKRDYLKMKEAQPVAGAGQTQVSAPARLSDLQPLVSTKAAATPRPTDTPKKERTRAKAK